MKTAIENFALEIWKQRELQFPERVRRMKPDKIDMASGAWQLLITCAEKGHDWIPWRHEQRCLRCGVLSNTIA